MAKSAGPKVDIETYMARDEWKSVPQFTKIKVENHLKELLAMNDEAKGKFSDLVPIPFSFDMSTLKKIVSESKSIQQSLKDLMQSHQADNHG